MGSGLPARFCNIFCTWSILQTGIPWPWFPVLCPCSWSLTYYNFWFSCCERLPWISLLNDEFITLKASHFIFIPYIISRKSSFGMSVSHGIFDGTFYLFFKTARHFLIISLSKLITELSIVSFFTRLSPVVALFLLLPRFYSI